VITRPFLDVLRDPARASVSSVASLMETILLTRLGIEGQIFLLILEKIRFPRKKTSNAPTVGAYFFPDKGLVFA